jgi:hypothetical protein
MTSAVRQLLESFDRLSEDERREAASEMLKRAPDFDYPPLDDETVDRLAEEVFLALDAREAADGRS